mmetsp:Transcript_10796/g.29633  ORF Transcript_10796/g.29633 Transcript_10796/m.29633 type:complete len:302 (-) Transcript_10796:813-1718(-)
MYCFRGGSGGTSHALRLQVTCRYWGLSICQERVRNLCLSILLVDKNAGARHTLGAPLRCLFQRSCWKGGLQLVIMCKTHCALVLGQLHKLLLFRGQHVRLPAPPRGPGFVSPTASAWWNSTTLLLLLQMLLLPLLQVLLLLLLPQVLLLLGLQGFCILSCSSRSCGLLLLARSGAVAAPTSMVTSRSRLSSAHFPGQREVAARRRAADLPGSCVVRARSFLCCVESAQPPPGPRRGVSDLCRPFAPGALPDAPVGLVGALGVDDISGWGSSADSALVMLLDRGFLLWLLLLPHRLPLSKVS